MATVKTASRNSGFPDFARIGMQIIAGCVALLLLSGCDPRPNRIGISNTVIDFGLNETPFPLYVWNTFSRIPVMHIEAEADVDWIQLTPSSVDSLWARESGYDKRSIIVRVNRSLLDEGEHKGQIKLTSTAMRPRKVDVRVYMESDGRLGGLNIINPVSWYSEPYLLDFAFSLRDADNNAVVEAPGLFDITAFEDGEAVRASETGLALRRASPRQFFLDLVLDYSLSMQETLGALQSLEDAARNDIVRFLNPDAAAGITLFNREDRPPVVISDFTTDHAYLREQLGRIQQEYVGRFASGAPLFDALQTSLDKFEEGQVLLGLMPDQLDPWLPLFVRLDENAVLNQCRHIFVITDGYDTSSKARLNDVTRRARNLFVSINVIGIGEEPHLANLLTLSGETKGVYFSFRDNRESISPYIEDIINNLAGQYRLRWATLNRRNQAFAPGFQMALASNSAAHYAEAKYNPVKYAADTLRGIIQVVHRDDGLRSDALVNMEYAPRFVYDLRFFIEASHPFEVEIWGEDAGGLLERWNIETTVVDDRRLQLHFYSLEAPLPFAGYGTLFSLDFGEVVSGERPEVVTCDIDNSLYEDAVHFLVEIE
ncbi:MAG TPA: hypothetical protein ENN29_08540 [Candidatus Hydrogenedentes bacterium]|nr:hypothetical protein [Candidatus Hydrogenedentota bacterium]